MPYQIRRLTIDDFNEVTRVWSDSGLPYKPKGRDSRSSIARELLISGVALFGMFDEHRMIGMAIANWDGRRGWVNRLAIDPEYRGQCLAGELIRECERFLEAQGATVIAALIEELNLPSMSAFEHEGYKCLPEIKYFSKRRSHDS